MAIDSPPLGTSQEPDLGRFWRALRRSRERMKTVNTVLAAVAAVGMVAIVALTSIDVVARKFDMTMGWPYEVILLIFGWAVFLGMGLVESERANIGVDIFGAYIPKALLRLRAIVMDTLALALVGTIAFLALRHVIRTYEVNERTNSLLALPVWVLELALAAGMIAFTITVLLELINDFSPAWRAEYADQSDVASEMV